MPVPAAESHLMPALAAESHLMSALIQESGNPVDNLPRFAFEPMTGDPNQLHTCELQVLVATTVFLEWLVRTVSCVHVQFDRKAQLVPVDIELVAGDVEASEGPGQPRLLHKRDKFTLQL